VTGGWRKLHNEGLHNLFSPASIIGMFKSRKMRWVWHVVRVGEMRNTRKISVGEPYGKRPLGGPRHRLEGNIKTDFIEIGCGGMDCIHLTQGRE
jgi:hypothetical protein